MEEKKRNILSAKHGIASQQKIQNTKRVTEFGRVNRTNDIQTEENATKNKGKSSKTS